MLCGKTFNRIRDKNSQRFWTSKIISYTTILKEFPIWTCSGAEIWFRKKLSLWKCFLFLLFTGKGLWDKKNGGYVGQMFVNEQINGVVKGGHLFVLCSSLSLYIYLFVHLFIQFIFCHRGYQMLSSLQQCNTIHSTSTEISIIVVPVGLMLYALCEGPSEGPSGS